jgi:hypothetical protein
VPDDLKADEAAAIALNNIVDMLDKIRLTLERLNKETEYHNTQRWYASSRRVVTQRAIAVRVGV